MKQTVLSRGRQWAVGNLIACFSSSVGTRSATGLTITLVNLMCWHPLPATEYQLRFSNIVTRSNNDCAL